MFKTKLSIFKKVIAVAVIQRTFVRDIIPIKSRLNNNTLDVFNVARKSTDSGSNDQEVEKRRQTIEKCFGKTPQPPEAKDLKDESSEREMEHRNVVPSDFVRLSDAEKSDLSNESDNEPSHETKGIQAEEATVRSTTANIAEETLDQKIETIDETPHVEASPQNFQGFNSTPKVLGHDIEFFADEKIQQIDLDDLAKRCVGASIGNIDEMLMKEMKNMANNDNKTQPDMNLIKSHGVEKYYSGIFEHLSQPTKKPTKGDDTAKEPLCLYYDDQIIGDKEMKVERITPLHIDSVHLFAFDEGSKDYKETGIFRDSSVYLSSDIEEPLRNLPNILTPYESPAIPFYEYVIKEQITLDDFDASKTMAIAEIAAGTGSVADIPTFDEVFLRKEDADEPSFVLEKHEMNSVESEPTVSHAAKPILQSNSKGENSPYEFANLSREQSLKLLYLSDNPAIKKTDESKVFSTKSDTPPIGSNPSTSSSISSTYTPGAASKDKEENVDMPVNTAISANQNPGEYYNMISLNEEELALKASEQLQTLTAESHIIHSFCTQLKKMENVSKETEDSIMLLEYPFLLRDPFSYLLFEPEMKENLVKEALNDKVTATIKEKSTVSVKNYATSVDDSIPLSQILKRIRDKNRLEFCRNLLLQSAKPETSTKFTCLASLEDSKQKGSPPPCQPPPKAPKEKCPKPGPPPCPPPKKDPCAKLVPFFLDTIIRFDVSCDIQVPMKQYTEIYYYKTMLTDDIIDRLRKLGEALRFVKVDRDPNYIKDATCARDFEPWIPIPSWPVPKVEKKRPFVCPKEGCRPVPVPRSNPPKQRPCLGVPKKSFSFSQVCLKPVNNPDIVFINL